MKISYNKFKNFIQVATMHVSSLKGKETHLSAAIMEVIAFTSDMEKKFRRDCEDADRKFATADRDGFLVKDTATGKYRHNARDEDKVVKAIRELEDEKDRYEITPCIIDADKVPADLTPLEILHFKGIVIPANYKKQIVKYEAEGEKSTPENGTDQSKKKEAVKDNG